MGKYKLTLVNKQYFFHNHNISLKTWNVFVIY